MCCLTFDVSVFPGPWTVIDVFITVQSLMARGQLDQWWINRFLVIYFLVNFTHHTCTIWLVELAVIKKTFQTRLLWKTPVFLSIMERFPVAVLALIYEWSGLSCFFKNNSYHKHSLGYPQQQQAPVCTLARQRADDHSSYLIYVGLGNYWTTQWISALFLFCCPCYCWLLSKKSLCNSKPWSSMTRTMWCPVSSWVKGTVHSKIKNTYFSPYL